MDYEHKYLKYKQKYLELKGGGNGIKSSKTGFEYDFKTVSLTLEKANIGTIYERDVYKLVYDVTITNGKSTQRKTQTITNSKLMHGFSLPLAPANSELLKHQCIKYLEEQEIERLRQEALKLERRRLHQLQLQVQAKPVEVVWEKL